MFILLNTTKTMDLGCAVPKGLRATAPVFATEAAGLIKPLQSKSPTALKKLMALSPTLADATKADLMTWGTSGNPSRPAMLAFTGLVYKYLDAPSLTAAEWKTAQGRLRILSGLYGVLRPRDSIEAYRLEMGLKYKPARAANLVAFWKDRITANLNRSLKKGEAVLSVAAQEYLKAVDLKALNGPVITPVFKERQADGGLKTAPVHAKMARGAMARFAIVHAIEDPSAMMDFGDLGWEASEPAPESGPWLFTRPVRD
jgi:cytoplasmic iron level regulating protein YaaA (DUF328/UPF0246 family)